MAKVLDGVDLNDPALLKNPQYQVAVSTIAALAAENNLESIARDWQKKEGALLKVAPREVHFFGSSFKAQVAADGQLSLQFMNEAGALVDSGGNMSLTLPTLSDRLKDAAANRIIAVKYEVAGRLAGLDEPIRERVLLPSALAQAHEVAEKVTPGRLAKVIEQTVNAVTQLLDAKVLAIAQCYSPGRVTIKTYNFIAKNLAVFEKLHAESPHMLPVLRKAIGERCIRKIDLNAFQRLKKWVRDAGYSEAAWKNLTRMSPQLLAQLTAEYDLDDCLQAADMVAALGTAPPSALLYSWLYRERGNPTPLWFRRAAAQHANGLSPAELERFMNNQYHPASNWVHALQTRPDANQMRARWAWIKRQADAWLEEIRQANNGNDCSWTTLVEEYAAGRGKYRIVPLTNSKQLRDEGNRMSHCVGRYNYDRKCLQGTSRIFSVRAAASGKSLATVELCLMSGKWHLNAIKASHNRAPKDCHAALMPELVQKYNDAYARIHAEATSEKTRS